MHDARPETVGLHHDRTLHERTGHATSAGNLRSAAGREDSAVSPHRRHRPVRRRVLVRRPGARRARLHAVAVARRGGIAGARRRGDDHRARPRHGLARPLGAHRRVAGPVPRGFGRTATAEAEGVISGDLGTGWTRGDDRDATVVFPAVPARPEPTGVHARHGTGDTLRCSDCAHGNHDPSARAPGPAPAARGPEWAGPGARLTTCACPQCHCSSTILTLAPAQTGGGRHRLRRIPEQALASVFTPAVEQAASASEPGPPGDSEGVPDTAGLRAAVLADTAARDPIAAAALTACLGPSAEVMQAVLDGLMRL
ncbi:hypothetical protein [Amycolatopsis sp. WGS_07]|uniref:hypothetical protein n=1 Tax=Amycolatopsis sp. WGS_07 TaxID=3076764 RepID=UPI0038737216